MEKQQQQQQQQQLHGTGIVTYEFTIKINQM